MISAAKNSNKFQKTRFWKKKSVEDVVTLGPTAQATLIYLMKEGSLFFFVVMRSIKLRCFILCSRCLWKALTEEVCMGLFPGCLDLWRKSS